ncbi:hypothetical protein NLI96_g6742 [Meripilus lineatus]|uniref:Large ribosomal subunit protein eL42 n=1 Tax=Meripilus lineatus TaxID=2056292 RepID=A0AAD5V118_9APHY|nr:hypothetical protein NLI96_g6742 [Physisporinus lineatus]
MPPSSQPGVPPKRHLASKESALFKELLNLYETRQLKKGLKTAETILKKYPEHGGRREEGIETVKKGMRFDLTSHICWHVFGLIQKGEKNYEEALKSYNMALRFDKENLNILRDTAHLHAQLRNFDSLVDIRHTLLKIRPNLRQNWVGLAVAYHLNGSLKEARKVLEHYELTLKNVPDYDVEHSEVLLYHVRLLHDLGENQEALNLLDICAKDRTIIDRTAIMEFRARILSKLKHNDAEHAWQALIQQNPDCYLYYKGFFSHRGIDLGMPDGSTNGNLTETFDTDFITDANREETLKLLREFTEHHSRAAAPRRLALNVAQGDTFRELASRYIYSALEKGIPSLFADLKAMYKDIPKREIIQSIVEDLREKLTPTDSQPTSQTPNDTSTSPPESEPPTTYLWTLYFLAQHYSQISQHPHALSLLEIAIRHTPTLPELFTCKARVLKRVGDPWGAARAMDEARVLDLQDRFLNTKCAKYRLRAGLEEEAQEVFGLFTKLFHEIEDDQFDFHGYSLRRFTINAYLDLVPWEDQLRSHPVYVQSAISAAQIWVQLHDDPSLVKKYSPSAGMTEAEKKEKRKKTKKAAHQKVQDEMKKTGNTNPSNEDKGLEPPSVKDDDSHGVKLIQATDGLDRAAKFLAPLLTVASKDIDVWIAAFDVAVRREKYLQALRALTHAKDLDAEHPDLHVRLIRFRKTISSLSKPPADPVGSVLSSTLDKLLPDGVSLETYNSQYLQKHSTSAPQILAVAQSLHILVSPLKEVEDTALQVLGPDVQMDLKTAVAVSSFLNDIKSGKAEDFRIACDKRFEHSTVFKSQKEQAALRSQAFATPDTVTGEEGEVNGQLKFMMIMDIQSCPLAVEITECKQPLIGWTEALIRHTCHRSVAERSLNLVLELDATSGRPESRTSLNTVNASLKPISPPTSSKMVNIPKTRRTYCKGKQCRKHTPHKVTQYKKGKDSLAAQGKRRYDRKQSGYGGQTKPVFHKKAKTTKKVVLRLECTSCKYKMQLALKRCKHFELGGEKKTKGAALQF